MTRDDLLAHLRRARVGKVRVPHKPLLLLWLFGRFAATGSSLAGEPVQSGHHEGVPGLQERQRGAQLGPVGVLAGLSCRGGSDAPVDRYGRAEAGTGE